VAKPEEFDVRIVKNKITGRSRGIAYIEFKDDATLQKVLDTMQGVMLNNFPLILAKSAPTKPLRNPAIPRPSTGPLLPRAIRTKVALNKTDASKQPANTNVIPQHSQDDAKLMPPPKPLSNQKFRKKFLRGQ